VYVHLCSHEFEPLVPQPSRLASTSEVEVQYMIAATCIGKSVHDFTRISMHKLVQRHVYCAQDIQVRQPATTTPIHHHRRRVERICNVIEYIIQ